MKLSTLAEWLNKNHGAAFHRVSGQIGKGDKSDIIIVGNCNMLRHPSGIWEGSFSARITQNSQTVSDYSYGISLDLICELMGMEPRSLIGISGGSWAAYDCAGVGADTEGHYGFGTTFEYFVLENNHQYLCPARIYTEAGALGAWAVTESFLAAGNRLTGTFYAKEV